MPQERIGDYLVTWTAFHSEMEVRTIAGVVVYKTSTKFIHETVSEDLRSRFDIYYHKNRKSYVFENV